MRAGRAGEVDAPVIGVTTGERIGAIAEVRGNPALQHRPAVRDHLSDPKVRELYFDLYYHHTWSWYQYGQTHKVAAKRLEAVKRAAGNIIRLQAAADQLGWQQIGPRLQELLRAEAPLREAYELLKNGAP